MELTPGTVIAGRYRIENRVGAGGMGEVWSGEHMSVGTRVALKTLLPAAAVNHEVVARFRREAYFLGRIRSDHVARVVDFVADDAVGLVLVMEYIEGEPLSKILQQKTLTVDEALELGVDIVTALRDLHQAKVIHRDLKPGNIIIQRRYDGSPRAVIVDFGVSRIVKGSSEDEEMTGITRADMAVGTIEYMAPEQILNSRDVTPASDLYAVGALLFRALAGHHVFGDLYDVELAKTKLTKDPTPLQTGRGDQVAKGLEEVVGKALKRKPKERYDSADRFLADLLALRDISRVGAAAPPGDMDLEATTHDVKSSIQAFADTTSSPSVTRPRLSSPGMAMPTPPPPSGPGRASSPSLIPGEAMAMRSTHPPSRGSLTGAVAASVQPKRKGVPLVATLALVLVALAGGAGLAFTVMQGKLKGFMEPRAEDLPSVTPAPSPEIAAAPVPPSAPSPSAAAAPAQGANAQDIDLDAPSGAATATAEAAPTQAPAATVAAAQPNPAPKPAALSTTSPSSKSTTTSAPSPVPQGGASPSATSTSTESTPAPKPKPVPSATSTTTSRATATPSSAPPFSTPGF
ncbi:serine/threonine-protein kinase [Chondromyces apiculatus]|uniref:Protein kinase domain-containing protein n=1 Tax=Chondromyces apiculatus DSM 436 TaxID=1192034 RepID=A0A017TBF9_9BACT|nr:serine/threonine-protein kinase [Chondromyces apiculatus]EYF06613.1 Hypothetical protein CAP_1743 [Chondromyces apiculatus DSM 436]